MAGRCVAWVAAVCVAGALLSGPAFAQEDKRTAKGLQDNSFIIEESYNQEPGVVQHIMSLRRQGRDWNFVFTQEWPLWSQTHQFSYSIPFARLRSNGQRASGIGDVYLNYRYQLLDETMQQPAIAPRFSLIVPSGNELRGLGDGSTGVEFNLPISKIVSDRVTLHGNLGLTHLFDVQTFSTTSYFLGGSAIYAVSRNLNFMFEVRHDWAELVDDTGMLGRERSLTMSPGMRYAFNLDAGQLVVGAGAPIVFTSGQPTSYGAILYLSFEHSFLKKK
ncbi:MAG: transporter [Xanthobacteraceae bacterium]|nr:transporter [Xanthobacteraceae bacterium]